MATDVSTMTAADFAVTLAGSERAQDSKADPPSGPVVVIIAEPELAAVHSMQQMIAREMAHLNEAHMAGMRNTQLGRQVKQLSSALLQGVQARLLLAQLDGKLDPLGDLSDGQIMDRMLADPDTRAVFTQMMREPGFVERYERAETQARAEALQAQNAKAERDYETR